MASSRDTLFEQAENVWNMLDDLVENDPDGYAKLMDKVKKDRDLWLKPPEPVFCFRTTMLPETGNHHIFVNVCQWQQVEASEYENKRISVFASDLCDLPNADAKHSVIAICFNPQVITDFLNTNDTYNIIASMAADYIEQKTGLQLSKAFKILNIKYKGDEKELQKFSLRMNSTVQASGKKSKNGQSQSVLQQLSSIVHSETDSKQCSSPPGAVWLPGDLNIGAKAQIQNVKKPIIEEVTPPSMMKTTPVQKNMLPKYNVEVFQATGTRPRCIVVTVELPSVQSGAECELDVSKEDLVLCSPHSAKLKLQLSERANPDETTSTFNKKTCQLTITIPVLTK